MTASKIHYLSGTGATFHPKNNVVLCFEGRLSHGCDVETVASLQKCPNPLVGSSLVMSDQSQRMQKVDEICRRECCFPKINPLASETDLLVSHHWSRTAPVLQIHLAIYLQPPLVMDPLWKTPNTPGCNDTGTARCKTLAYGETTQH